MLVALGQVIIKLNLLSIRGSPVLSHELQVWLVSCRM